MLGVGGVGLRAWGMVIDDLGWAGTAGGGAGGICDGEQGYAARVISVRAKSSPVNSNGSPVAFAKA